MRIPLNITYHTKDEFKRICQNEKIPCFWNREKKTWEIEHSNPENLPNSLINLLKGNLPKLTNPPTLQVKNPPKETPITQLNPPKRTPKTAELEDLQHLDPNLYNQTPEAPEAPEALEALEALETKRDLLNNDHKAQQKGIPLGNILRKTLLQSQKLLILAAITTSLLGGTLHLKSKPQNPRKDPLYQTSQILTGDDLYFHQEKLNKEKTQHEEDLKWATNLSKEILKNEGQNNPTPENLNPLITLLLEIQSIWNEKNEANPTGEILKETKQEESKKTQDRRIRAVQKKLDNPLFTITSLKETQWIIEKEFYHPSDTQKDPEKTIKRAIEKGIQTTKNAESLLDQISSKTGKELTKETKNQTVKNIIILEILLKKNEHERVYQIQTPQETLIERIRTLHTITKQFENLQIPELKTLADTTKKEIEENIPKELWKEAHKHLSQIKSQSKPNTKPIDMTA